MTPPIINAVTQNQFTSAQPREIKKPIEAETAIANSLVSTVPTTFLALIPFLVKRTGVAIGPHPPPPVASIKPAINPNGMDCFRVSVDLLFSTIGLKLNKKRNRTYAPNINRKIETYGLANSPGILLKKVAPKKAPMDPGMINL